MQKVLAALWARDGETREDFGARLLRDLPGPLAAAGATRIRLNIRDAAVAPSAGHIQQWQTPQQDAIAQFWLPTTNVHFRGPAMDALSAVSGRFAAWEVTEGEIIRNTLHPPVPGQRTHGWSQASFLNFPPDLPRADAMAHWEQHHTRIGIDTQANFEYIQNPIIRPLTDDAPHYDAFVEECFPDAAMTNPAAFYDAVGDDAKYQSNLAIMMDSCNRFLDFTRLDIIPTSQWQVASH